MNMSMVASSTTAAPNGLGMSGPGVPGGTTGTAGMGSMAQMNDTDSTVSLKSTDSSGEAPVIDDPVFEMWRAVTTCQDQQSNRRDIVDAFHSWQKSAVSKQAAQQKALHVYLKRRLRKRTTRLPEVDRSEEEALRNARRGLDDDEEEDNNKNNKNKNKNNANGGSVGGDDKVNNEQRQAATRRKTNELIEENSLHGNTLVPSKVRLPLEAYLPRRVRPARDKPTVDDLWSIVPDPPRLPTALKSQGKSWLTLPTVNPSSEWNSRKSSTTAGTVATATMATATMAAIVGHKRPLDGGDGGLPHENEHDDH